MSESMDIVRQPLTTRGGLCWWFWVVLVAMCGLKLAVVAGQPFAAHMAAEYDDALFAQLANSIYHGRWLGAYDHLTLIKGPFYPMFIAASRWGRVPLPVAEQLMFIAAAVLGVLALRPKVRSGCLLLAGALLLLYGPFSWGEFPARFSRDVISTPLAVLVMAGACGMLLRHERSVWAVTPWAILCGLAMSGLWLAREEAIWLVGPTIILCAGAAALMLWRGVASNWRRAALLTLVPPICAAIPVLAVCEANRRHYGYFGVVELKAPQFEAAYGALTRVGQTFNRQHVPCPAEARELIYAASPAFRELQPYLDGPIGKRWTGSGILAEQSDMQGGWFIWALRESAVRAGVHGRSGPNLAWYQQLADEINAACDAGRLPGGPRHDTTTTRFIPAYIPAITDSLGYFGREAFAWRGQWDGPLSSDGLRRQLEMAEDLVQTPLVPVDQKLTVTGWVVVTGRPFTVQVLAPSVKSQGFMIQWQNSLDVQKYFDKRGIAASAERARFTVTCANRPGMLLSVRDGATELGRITLAAGNHLASGGVYAHIEQVESPDGGRISGWRAALVERARSAVQAASPVLTAISVLWLVAAVVCWRRVSPGIMAAVLSVILGAVAIRIGLFAYIDATTFTARVPRYLAPGMLLLAYGWLVAAVSAMDWWGRWRASASPKRERADLAEASQHAA